MTSLLVLLKLRGEGAVATPTPPPPAAGEIGSGARAEASKMRGTLEAKKHKAREVLKQVQAIAPALEKRIAATRGEEKKGFISQRALLTKKSAEAVETIEQADADLDAIANPASTQEDLVRIMARAGSKGLADMRFDVSSGGSTALNKQRTVTTTSAEKGVVRIEKDHEQRNVGLDGATMKKSREEETMDEHGSLTRSEEKITRVSLTGKATHERRSRLEIVSADGSKTSIEHSSEISRKGASRTTTQATEHADGTSVKDSRTKSVEREDGKVTVKAETSVEKKNAAGTTTATSGAASGGFSSKGNAVGVHGGVDGGKKITSKKGHNVALGAGAKGNVSVEIGEPKGEPPLYAVTLTVSFGVSARVSASRSKDAGSSAVRTGVKGSAGVEAHASVTHDMVKVYQLGEAELADYVKTLEAASKGSKVAATHKEFEIILAGVNQDWGAAGRLWSAHNAPTVDDARALRHKGDSVEFTDTREAGAGVQAKAVGVGVDLGVNVRSSEAKKLSRNEDDKNQLDSTNAETVEKHVSASLSAGVASVKVGVSHTVETKFGFSIEVDPKQDPDGKILAHLLSCKSELSYAVFINIYRPTRKARLIGTMNAKTVADATEIGIGLGALEASIGTGHSVGREVERDGAGKVVKETVTGEANAGGKLGSWADSKSEKALSKVDAEGNASLSLTTNRSDNHNSRARSKKTQKVLGRLGLVPGGGGPAKGALATAGGAKDDTDVKDTSGLGLSSADLKKIGASCCRSLEAWMGSVKSPSQIADWKAAGVAIRKAKGSPGMVSQQLAIFIGKDTGNMEMVLAHIRGGYNQRHVGEAFEFPDGLADVRADYEAVMSKTLEKEMNELAKTDHLKAADNCKRLAAMAATIASRIASSAEFRDESVKAEMLSRLGRKRTQLEGSVLTLVGKDPDKDPEVFKAESKRLMDQLGTFFASQERIKGELVDLLDGYDEFVSRDKSEARGYIRQIEDLHDHWWGVYRMTTELYANNGFPNFQLPPIFRPNEQLIAIWEAAVEK